jgi:hypothetical protein
MVSLKRQETSFIYERRNSSLFNTPKPKPIDPTSDLGNIRVTQAYNSLINKLKPLDFFCVEGDGILSWGIKLVTKNLSPDREAEFNHAGIFPDGSACTLEALWKLESHNFFERYEGYNAIIGRWKKMNPKIALKVLKKTNKHIGQWYPTYRIALHLINVAHIIHWSNALVCSEYVAKILHKAGARHHRYHGTTPDAIADEIKREVNKERNGCKYEIVFQGKLPYNFYRYCSFCKTFWLVPYTIYLCPSCNCHFIVEDQKNPPIEDQNLKNKILSYNETKCIYVEKKHLRKSKHMSL